MHTFKLTTAAAAALSLISLAGCYSAADIDDADRRYDVQFDRAYPNHGDHYTQTYTTTTTQRPVVVREREVVVPREEQPGHYDIVTHPDGSRERVWVPDTAGHWDTITHPDGTTERVWVPAR